MVEQLNRLMVVAVVCMATTMLSAKTSRVDSLSLRLCTLEQKVAERQFKTESIQKELSICEKKVSAISEHVDRVNKEVSSQIAASSHTIQVWGWIIAIMAFVFGFYINRMWKKISDATANAKEQLRQAKEASEDIADEQQRVNAQQQAVKKMQEDTEAKLQELQNLHADIQNNMSAIYEKLKREETIALLNHLEGIPEDIANTSELLLARELQEKDFSKLLNAYHNLIARGLELNGISSVSELRKRDKGYRSHEGSYALQFAQHFMAKSIMEKDLQEILQPRFGIFFNECFFRNDAEKSTKDFKKGVSSLDDQQKVDLIMEYILAMSKSQYARFTEWYEILLADLTENQLEEVWNGVTKDHTKAIYFARTIKDVMMAVNSQSTLIERVLTYINDAEKNTSNNTSENM